MSTRSRRLARALTAALVVAAATTACGDEAGTTALTRNQIEERSGLTLPASVEGFRATRTTTDQLQVTATVTDADGTRLADDLGLEADRRVVTHSSPLWELNPSGTIRGGTSRHEEVERTVEVIDDDGARSTVRMILDGI